MAMSTSGESVIHYQEAACPGSFKESEQNTPQDSESSDEDERLSGNAVPELFANEEQQLKWITAGWRRFKDLAIASKGLVTKPVLKHLKKYLRGTKVIFVIGKSGTGKTTILQEISGLDLKVGGTLKSGTLKCQVCPAVIDNEQYIFIDTAGFGAADMNDEQNHLNIVSSLMALGDFVEFAGLLFVYGSANEKRSMKPDIKTMQWAQCFFGPDFYRKITIVTTMWDEFSESAMEGILTKGGKLDELTVALQDILAPPDQYHGGLFYHHGLPNGKATSNFQIPVLGIKMKSERGDAVRKMIHEHYRACDPHPAKLQIQCELDEGRDPMETEAARVLSTPTESTKIIIQGGRAIVTTVVHILPTRAAPTSYSTPNDPLAPNTQIRSAQPASPYNTSESSTKDLVKQETKKEIKKPNDREEKTGRPRPSKTSWFEAICIWFQVATNTAGYFKEYHKQARKNPNSSARPFWGIIKNWWSGDQTKE